MRKKPGAADEAIEIARELGMARAQDFRDAGISPACLTRLCEEGRLTRLARGLYQLADADFDAARSLAEAACLAPHGVISLASALCFHELTTQLPHAVWMTFHHKARVSRRFPFRVEVMRASGESFTAGRATARIEGVYVEIYNPSKTIADCFKYRNRIGLDVALEALRDGLRSKRATVDEVWRFALINRVAAFMRPYLEAVL